MAGGDFLAALERLREKYSLLAALRGRRDEAESAGETTFDAAELADRTASFRRIAEEFPGSLRELEISTAERLLSKARIVAQEITAARSDPSRPEPLKPWVAVVLDYHATLREALAVKMWLATHVKGMKAVEPATLSAFLRWHGGWPHRHGLLDPADAAFLQAHRSPPGGRLHNLVFGAVGKRHGLSRTEAEAVVFGPAG